MIHCHIRHHQLWVFFPPQASVSYHLHHLLVFISLVLCETQRLCLLTTFFWGRKKEGQVLPGFWSSGVERGAMSLIPHQTLCWARPSQCYPRVFAHAGVLLNVHHVLTLHVWEPAFPSDIPPVETSLPLPTPHHISSFTKCLKCCDIIAWGHWSSRWLE